jgi:hypothetical protein
MMSACADAAVRTAATNPKTTERFICLVPLIATTVGGSNGIKAA